MARSLRTTNRRRWRASNRPNVEFGAIYAMELRGGRLVGHFYTIRGGREVRYTEKPLLQSDSAEGH